MLIGHPGPLGALSKSLKLSSDLHNQWYSDHGGMWIIGIHLYVIVIDYSKILL